MGGAAGSAVKFTALPAKKTNYFHPPHKTPVVIGEKNSE
jgi:hypothetical protein